MKIIVLNGSPKGEISVTMQYVHYIQKIFPQHEMKILNISQNIKKIENDKTCFDDTIWEIKNADGILWAFPLYVYLVHSNYKRFIELLWERNTIDSFNDKYTAALSTSIHFYDNTAHNYIHAICDDLKMKYINNFSAKMEDLLKKEGQNKLISFANDFFGSIERKAAVSRTYQPLTKNTLIYKSGTINEKYETTNKKIVVITDSYDLNTNLGQMIDRFKNLFTQPIEIIDINNINIKGGCIGCIQCGFNNECFYGDSDDIKNIYNNKIKTADIVIYAGTIIDRYFSARWKMFIDRRFFNTHQPILNNKQVGYILSGPLNQVANLREIIQATIEFDQANLVDIITDEYPDSKTIDALLDNFAFRLIKFANEQYIKPRTFLGISGMRIFRDDVFGHLRFIFQADHRYYKKHGIYDFPQKDIKTRITNFFLIPLTKIPIIKKTIQKNTKKFMILPFKQILETK